MVVIQCLILLLLPSTTTTVDDDDVQERDHHELDKSECISALLGMDISLYSMEVVNQLAAYSILPTTASATNDDDDIPRYYNKTISV